MKHLTRISFCVQEPGMVSFCGLSDMEASNPKISRSSILDSYTMKLFSGRILPSTTKLPLATFNLLSLCPFFRLQYYHLIPFYFEFVEVLDTNTLLANKRNEELL